MKQYKFMNPKSRLSKLEAEVYLKKKYGIDVVSDFEDYDSEIPQYINRFVDESGYKEKINLPALGVIPSDEKKRVIWEKLIKEVCNIIDEPISYCDDTHCAIYMGWIYNNANDEIFKKEINIRRKKGESEDTWEKRVRAKKALEKTKTDIQIAWKKSDSRVNKELVRKLYPVPVVQMCDMNSFKNDEYDIEDEADKYEIQSIPGGCVRYHKTMISLSHINIFDVESDIEDYTRYSFKNTYAIYSALKESYMENLLLMEYSLGIGYINQIYPYVRMFGSVRELEGSLSVIRTGTTLTPFVIRKKIMDLIFSSGIKMSSEEEVCNAIKFVEVIKNVVSEIFEQILEIEWYKYNYFLSDVAGRMRHLHLQVKSAWEKYYNDEEAYKNWTKECHICDWRNVRQVQDCFYDVLPEEKLIALTKSSSLSFEYLNEVIQWEIHNVFGQSVILVVGKARNEAGKKIKSQVEEEMREMEFPDTVEELYDIYYKLRNKAYKEIKEKEKKIFNKMEIKIRKNGKGKEQRLEQKHVYAILSREVIKTLLCIK